MSENKPVYPPARRRPVSDQDLSQVKRVHLSAICGTGMGSLAGLLVQMGYQVSGSDKDVYPPMSTQLQRLGIQIQEGYDARRLEGVDLVIIGNAISRGNVELEAALEKNLAIFSLPEALERIFLRNRRSVVITGTHGKTTTSAITTFLLSECGQNPGFLVGGVLANYDLSSKLGPQGAAFVVEGDEYDSACFDKRPKFIHYHPEVAVLTSIEFDHADIYADLAAVKDAFRGFLGNLRRESLLIYASEDPQIQSLLPAVDCQKVSYGLDPADNLSAKVLERRATGIHFELFRDGKALGRFETPLLGDYNLQNLLAALAVCRQFGVSEADALAKISGFRNVLRRQQIRGVVRGVRVVDDFAHHPTAVRVTLEGLRQGYPEGRLWAIFEPRTATSRRRIFQAEYAKSFAVADEIVIAEVFRREALAEKDRFSSEELVADLRAMGKQARFFPSVDDIVEVVVKECRAGDTLAILSNGGFGGIHEKILRELAKAG